MRTIPLRSTLAAVSLAAALGLAACSHEDMAGMPGMSGSGSAAPAGPASATPSPTGTPASGPHNDADVMFAQGMIPHHAQAVEMSDVLLAKDGIDSRVTDLATQIKGAQAPEIGQMAAWLDGWGVPATPSGDMHHHHGGPGHAMGGMLSSDELDELKAATGTDAARTFLHGMTKHHRGAVSMAQDELESGQNSDAMGLARTMVRSQEAEIQRMDTLLRDL